MRPASAVPEHEVTIDETEPPASFESFFEAEQPRLLRALYLVTGNAHEAEEIVQDAFVTVWERWPQVAAMDDPTGYVYRVAMNRFRSRLRRAKVAARRLFASAEGGDAFELADERDALARGLASLPDRQRSAIVLTELLGFGSAEAGRILGVKDVTVRSLASQARAALRTHLEDRDD